MSNEWSYIWGQCTYYVAKALDWVPAGLGNANTWIDNARAQGFTISDTPKPGDVVEYVGQGYSQFGHVGVVEKVYSDHTFDVNEMNFLGENQTDTRHSTMAGVAGFIEPPAGRGSVPDPFGTLLGFGAGTPPPSSSGNPVGDAAGGIAGIPGAIAGLPGGFAKAGADAGKGVQKYFSDIGHAIEEAFLVTSIGFGLFVLAMILIFVGLFAITQSNDSDGGTKIVPIPV